MIRRTEGPRPHAWGGLLTLLLAAVLALGLAACGNEEEESAGGNGGSAASTETSEAGGDGPPQGEVEKMAAFGLASPETNRWDRGGHAAFEKAATILGAEPTWLSNIAFDQTPQVLQRLIRDDFPVMVSNGSGFADGMLDAAAQNPDRWFWVYSDLASTNDLPNVVGVKLHWNEIGYLAAAIACEASKSKKIGLVIAQPIPAYAHAAAGIKDGAAATCGSEDDVTITWTGTFDDNAKTKRATEALIADGADVITDFQDAATDGVQAGIKEHPDVRYVGTMFDWSDAPLPEQIITSVYIDYESGYLPLAELMLDGELEPKIYESSVATGGIKLTEIRNADDSVAEKAQELFQGIQSGDVKVDIEKTVEG